jgi:very-short-patch-repair endonuclease
LFARKRSPSFLIDDLRRLRDNLKNLTEIPEGPRALVSELSDEPIRVTPIRFRGRSSSTASGNGSKFKELYFPKPYNDEQVAIVEKLERNPGVVVQGPPGTGKTHTIANVICHYLATGRRVLVTSKGEPALAVLRGQIPESIRPLSVALLTDERDGMRQFEHAIQIIATRVALMNPEADRLEVARLEGHIDELHAKLAATDHDIASWAKKHLEKVTFGDQKLLPEQLARLVVQQERDHQWFPDPLGGELAAPSVSEEDIRALREARRVLADDIAYAGCVLPNPAEICSPNDLLHAHEDLVRAADLADKVSSAAVLKLAGTDAEVLKAAESLLNLLSEALTTHDDIAGAQVAGTEGLRRRYERGADSAAQGLDAVIAEAADLEVERQAFLASPVTMPAGSELQEEFQEAVDRLAAGKSAVGIFSFGRGPLKERIASVTIAALPAANEEDWMHVKTALAFNRKLRAFLSRWNAAAAEVGIPQVAVDPIAGYSQARTLVDHVRLVRRIAIDYRSRARDLAGKAFGTDGRLSDLLESRDSIVRARELLSDNLTHIRLRTAANALRRQIEGLRKSSGAVVKQMLDLLTDAVGQRGHDGQMIARSWGEFLAEVQRLRALQPQLDAVTRVTQFIADAGATEWAALLRAEPVKGTTDRWLPLSWREAWIWRQAATYVDRIDGRHELKRLQAVRNATEGDLARAYEKIVEHKTWLEVFRNSSPAVKGALQAYLTAIRAIGKGTGVRAVRHRKAARAAMQDAYRAVPCWIMPQWRVSESLPAEIGKYDLVIVDEASQSDLWVLPSLLRGTKVLVVGDDKQVSPDGIGLAEERIKDLKQRFLSVQAHADQMTPEKSMYDLAKVVFAGEMVMLREHFRCVAPIIEFSKREFYGHEIRPLRLPKGVERLDPPLVDVFVRGGARTDKINSGEARAIVDEIKRILADECCEGQTIGVVSLLGAEQANRIYEIISEEIAAEEIVARKITVGDARTFQGKERDIMLLSMVAVPGNARALTAQMYAQRFNVAASRARNRMYLFRSVEIADLNPQDLRTKLIEHFRAPFHQEPRRVVQLRDLCESEFEREFFDELNKRGYRVQPQVRVGDFRIDLVVEGIEDRRLAIECDGDKFHGPEQWSHDMARQRVLERAGWTFWRCFGSSFARDRDGVLQDLVETMNRLGIEPIGAAERVGETYTEHRTVTAPGARGGREEGQTAEEQGRSDEIQGNEMPAGKNDGATPQPSAPPVQQAVSPDSASGLDSGSSELPRPNPSTAPPQSSSLEPGQGFSDEALVAFLNRHALKSEDMRSRGGALWVSGSASPEISRQLKAWGFQFTAKRGWWRK